MRIKCSECLTELTVGSVSDSVTVCPNCGSDLRIDVDRYAATVSSDSTEPLANLEVPTSIGRYRVQRMVGAGAYGIVYKARDEQLECDIAIKVPRARKHRDEVTAILPEARALAKLRHPNIVRVLAAEPHGSGSYCVVMDWIDGKTLREKLAIERLSIDHCVAIMISICDAVHAAHKAGFVHRDLKPANILIDRSGKPFVSDFGLALEESIQHERRGEVAGTLAYMSPEQVRGEAHYLDGRSDVWALGVILYEMLAGRRPFVGEREQIVDEICHRDPKPLSLYNEQVTQQLDDIVRGCLTKDIESRTRTAGAVRDALIQLRAASADDAPSKPTAWGSWKGVAILLLCAAFVGVIAAGLIVNDMRPGFLHGNSSSAMRGRYRERPAGPLVAGKWNKLLDRPLNKLLWPVTETGARVIPEPELENLTVISQGRVILGARDIKHRDCRIMLNIYQAAWTGRLGIFYGMETQGDRLRYEQIELVCATTRRDQRRINRLDRGIIECNGDFHQIDCHWVASAEIPPPGRKKYELLLTFQDGQLVAVSWDGQYLDSLLRIEDPLVIPPGVTGTVGVYLREASAEFSLFRVYVSEEP